MIPTLVALIAGCADLDQQGPEPESVDEVTLLPEDEIATSVPEATDGVESPTESDAPLETQALALRCEDRCGLRYTACVAVCGTSGSVLEIAACYATCHRRMERCAADCEPRETPPPMMADGCVRGMQCCDRLNPGDEKCLRCIADGLTCQ